MRFPRTVIAVLAASAALTAAHGAEDTMAKKVKLPKRLMLGSEVLNEIFLQTGTRYAYPPGILVRQIDATPFGGEATVKQLAGKLAPEHSLVGGALLLEKKLADAEFKKLIDKLTAESPASRRAACYLLARCGSIKAVGPLFKALEDKDESVCHHALRALVYLHEGTEHEPEALPRGRASFVKTGGKLPVKTLMGFLKKANDPSENEWIWAAKLLVAEAPPGAVKEFQKGAKHGYRRTQEVAAAALNEIYAREKLMKLPPIPPGDKRDAASAKKLLAGLSSKDAYKRAAAARIVFLRNDIGAKPVITALGAEKRAGVRGELLLTLGRKGGKAAWDLLLKEITNPDPVVRHAALRGLSRCPDERAVGPLFKTLSGPNVESEDRYYAAVSLGLIASPKIVAVLGKYITETRMPISTAALALGYIATPETQAALMKCLEIKKDSLKCYAFTGLARLGTKRAVDFLAGKYNQYDNTARYCGHAAIRRVRNQEGIDRFVAVINSGKGRIAPHGLEECSDPRAVDALIKALPASKGKRLLFAIQSLGRIGDPQAVPALTAAMGRGPEWARYEALRALRWRWYWFRPDVRAAVKAHPVFKHFLAKHPAAADQPENTWVCRLWPVDFDDHRAVKTAYEAGMVFDEKAGQALKWGSHGGRCDAPQLGETWMYDATANKWHEKDPPVSPVGMCGTIGVSYDKALGKTVSMRSYGGGHGWQWQRGKFLRQSAPWVYDSAKDIWTPARPAAGPGCRGFVAVSYLQQHQVHMLYGGQGGSSKGRNNVWLYDLYANTWHMQPASDPLPGSRTYQGMVYLPGPDKVLMKGGTYGAANRDRNTWLYDAAANKWTNTKAGGKPPQFRKPMVYDPVTGTVLAFRSEASHPTVIWQYNPQANTWKTLPPAPEPTPHHGSVDVCYDPVNDVFIMDGGHVNWETDHIAVREVWTYKFKNRPIIKGGPPNPAADTVMREVGGKMVMDARWEWEAGALPAPAGVTVEVKKGKAVLTWKAVKAATGYNVYRGVGTVPWKIKYAKVTAKPVKKTQFTDPAAPPADGKKMVFYYVTAISKDGKEGPASFKVRTQPPVPTELVVSVMPDRTAELAWAKGPARDVVGWHVYASSVRPSKRLSTNCNERFTAWEKLTKTPLKKPAFTDKRKLGKTDGAFSHEVRAYQVRAVNSLGVESGPSEMGFTLTGSVPHVRAKQQPDGSARITWKPVREKAVLGYAVYRLDEVRLNACLRLTPHPVKGTEFVDRAETPRAERRRYYVVAIDALGEEGLPSAGAWSFGRP